jgi:hypothetical protein
MAKPILTLGRVFVGDVDVNLEPVKQGRSM